MVMFHKKLGMMGQIFDSLAWTIIFSLLCSLVVAVALVPVLTSNYLKISRMSDHRSSGFFASVNRLFNNFFNNLDNGYARCVKTVLKHKKLFIFGLVGLFFLSIATVKFVGFIFMPEAASNYIEVELEMPRGTTLDITNQMAESLRSTALQELKGVKYSAIMSGGSGMWSADKGTNNASIIFAFYSESNREPGWDSEKTAKEKLRKYFTMFPGASMKFAANRNSASTGGLSVDIKCDDLNLLRETSRKVEKLLKEQAQEFVTEVSSDLEEGLPQAEIIVDRSKMYELGLNVYNVGSEIRGAINGTTASRYTDKGNDIDVVVRMSEKDTSRLDDLDEISVVNSQGLRVPLSSFAHYEQTLAPVTIRRQNQSRIIHISVKPLTGKSLDVVQSGVMKIINDNIPADENVRINISGDYEEMMKAVVNFGAIILMATILVFVVMASQFESLLDPFIVLLTIPLSFIGVMTIYAMTRNQLSIVTVMGILVLVGTIVNNGIVLVDYTNLLRKRGYSLDEACVEAARNRLRPILMSTLTTVISLMPMAFFPGEGSASMQPISLTVFGGMTFGSLMTLFLMPAVYHIFNARRERVAAKKALKQQKKLGGAK